jgi:hypothetical protein
MIDISTSLMLFALSWGLVLLAAFVTLPGLLARTLMNGRPALGLAVVVGIALCVRLLPNAVLPMGAGYDIDSYELVADSVLSGRDVYTYPETMNRHPYLPFQMYWMAMARWASSATQLPFVKIVRLAPILADSVLAALLYTYARRTQSPALALESGLLYALNPVSVFISAYHGQFDAIPLLFLTLAIVSFLTSTTGSFAWLGLGVLSKSWPILGFPAFWWHLKSRRERIVLPLLLGIVPLLATGFYGLAFSGSVNAVLAKAMGYDWGVGAWGYTYLFRLADLVVPDSWGLMTFAGRYGRFVTLALLAITWVVFARSQPLVSQVLTIFVTFFALTHAFSIQYLVWLIPLAILDHDRRWLNRYTLAATAYMLLVYTTLILEFRINALLPWPQANWFIIMPSALPAWIVTVGWSISRWKVRPV